MMPKFGIKAVVIILIAVAVTAALGWAYSEHRKRELREAVAALVADTSLRLRDALSIEAGATAAIRPETGRKLDADVATVERHLVKLRDLDTPSIGALVDVANDYILTGREILRRQASSHRYRLQLSGSLLALRDHMRADDRSGSWVPEAVRAKERVEEDYRNYKLAVDALGKLLESFPASRAKMAPHVNAALLTDENLVEAARRRALEDSKHATDEIEKARQLEAYR
jgi:hypothetical protein